MDEFDLVELDCIDTTLPDIDLDGILTMDDVRIFLTNHKSLDEINAALKANHTLYTEKISIRIPHNVLSALKSDAEQAGLKYQTLINLILADFVARQRNPEEGRSS